MSITPYLVWNETPAGYESDDWRWILTRDADGTYTVYDKVEDEEIAFGLTLDAAKSRADAMNAHYAMGGL